MLVLVMTPVLPCQVEDRPFKVFIDNQPAAIDTTLKDGQVFISVRDLSRYFESQFLLIPQEKKLKIYTRTTETPGVLTPGKRDPEANFQGQVLLEVKNGLEFPARGAKVVLYDYNPEVPERQALEDFEKWVCGESNTYPQTHGKVRESTTNHSGRFYLKRVPPGNYELTAIYYNLKGESGIYWRKKIKVEKNQSFDVKLTTDEGYRFGK